MFAPRFSPWLRLVWFGLGALIGQAAFGAVIVAALSMAALLSGQNPDTLREEGVTRYALWIAVLSYPPIWLWLMFCRRHFDRRSVRSLGLRLESWGRSLGGGILAGTLAISWLFGLLWLCGSVRFSGLSPDAFDQTPLAIAGYLLLYAGAFACIGFMEEAIFRGYLLHNLNASLGLRRAIWLQAIVFSLVHLGNLAIALKSAADDEAVRVIWVDAARAIPSIALIGAIFALCWAKTGSLWFPIGFHAAWNFCLGCVFSLPVSGITTFRLFDISPIGNSWLHGGSFGAEGSVLLWPMLGVLWWALHRVPDHPQIARDLALLDPNQRFEIVPTAPIVVPIVETEFEDDEDAPRESRFKTSMRQKDETANTPIPIWGQLPHQNSNPNSWQLDAPPETAPVSPLNNSEPARNEAPRSESLRGVEEFIFQPLKIPQRENDVANLPLVDEEPIVAAETETAAGETSISRETETQATPSPEVTPVPEATPTPVTQPRPPAPRW